MLHWLYNIKSHFCACTVISKEGVYIARRKICLAFATSYDICTILIKEESLLKVTQMCHFELQEFWSCCDRITAQCKVSLPDHSSWWPWSWRITFHIVRWGCLILGRSETWQLLYLQKHPLDLRGFFLLIDLIGNVGRLAL